MQKNNLKISCPSKELELLTLCRVFILFCLPVPGLRTTFLMDLENLMGLIFCLVKHIQFPFKLIKQVCNNCDSHTHTKHKKVKQ